MVRTIEYMGDKTQTQLLPVRLRENASGVINYKVHIVKLTRFSVLVFEVVFNAKK